MAQPSALFLYNGVFVLDLRLPIATARIRLSFVTRASLPLASPGRGPGSGEFPAAPLGCAAG
jgi:hypothetical protein